MPWNTARKYEIAWASMSGGPLINGDI
jgi:hypothetical protein